MNYKAVPFEQRIKDNVKNYGMDHLYQIDAIAECMKALNALSGLEVLLTERHGEKVVSVGNFAGFTPDVVGDPGRKIRVYGRTVAHLYAKTDSVAADKREEAEKLDRKSTRLNSSHMA